MKYGKIDLTEGISHHMLEKLKEKYKDNKFVVFIFELLRRFKEDDVMATGAQLAYHLIMAFFPFLIFLLNLAAFTPIGQEGVINEIFSILPNDTTELIKPIILDVISSRSASLLSLSLILALWSGSAGINSLISAMGKAFDIENNYKPWLKRILSIFYTFVLALIILLIIMGPIFGEVLINVINSLPLGNLELGWIVRLVVTLLPIPIMILGFAAIYKWGPGFPENNKITFKEALVGASIATILFFILSYGFSFYVNNFGNYANTYGALGGIIILLIWLFLSSTTIMLGAEIVATYVSMKRNTIGQRLNEDEPVMLSESQPTQTDHHQSDVVNKSVSEPGQKGLGGAVFFSLISVVLLKVMKSIFK